MSDFEGIRQFLIGLRGIIIARMAHNFLRMNYRLIVSTRKTYFHNRNMRFSIHLEYCCQWISIKFQLIKKYVPSWSIQWGNELWIKWYKIWRKTRLISNQTINNNRYFCDKNGQKYFLLRYISISLSRYRNLCAINVWSWVISN